MMFYYTSKQQKAESNIASAFCFPPKADITF